MLRHIDSYETESNSSEDTSETSNTSWIESFCMERGHEWFCEISHQYITDPATLSGITLRNGQLARTLSGILDLDPSEDSNDPYSQGLLSSMEELYSLIHARYICTKEGLARMV